MLWRLSGLLWNVTFFMIYLSSRILCLPRELVLNGGFDQQLFDLSDNETKVSISKSKDKMPFWKILNGSIQVVSSNYLYPDSTWNRVGNYCVHINDEKGPGTIYSAPLIGQIAGATYNLSINMVGSPWGGELYKKIQISVVFRRRFFYWLFSEHKYDQYNASNPYESRLKLSWTTKMYTYVGTGRETKIKITSKSDGSNGFLIDNVHVGLHNIIDNGSFEQLSKDVTNTFLDSDIVSSPSWKISKWYLESGSVKYITGRFQPSTDLSATVLDLNGNEPGLLSCNVSTVSNKYYYISFDYAANPEAGRVVKGYFSLTVYSGSDDKSSIKKQWVRVTSKGCTKSLVGWKSSTVGFYAKSNTTNVKFQSTVKGVFGPLLDNVEMYQYTTPFSASKPQGDLTFNELAVLLSSLCLSLYTL